MIFFDGWELLPASRHVVAARISKALVLGLVAVEAAACAPQVTIVDVSAGGESGEDGNPVTGGTGGVAGMSSTGGSTSSGGVSSGGLGGDNGFGGFAGARPPTDCEQPLDTSTLGCDVESFMRSHCARGGCHNAATRSGQLDLTMDALLIARILEVPAKHVITCPGGLGQCNLAAPQCDSCKMCPVGDFLLTKANFAESWMIKKMDAFDVSMPSAVQNMGCGTAMPYPPGTTSFDAERRACLTDFFRWIADNGRPCDISTGGTGGGGAGE